MTQFRYVMSSLLCIGCVAFLVNVAGQSLAETPNQSTGTQQVHRVKGWAR
jgi:hypothetical protein